MRPAVPSKKMAKENTKISCMYVLIETLEKMPWQYCHIITWKAGDKN